MVVPKLHSHWPKGWHEHDTLLCQLPKAECDALWTAYLHDHVGLACRKEIKPGNKTATCTLRGQAKREGHADKVAREQEQFDAYIESEARRVAEILEEYPNAE